MVMKEGVYEWNFEPTTYNVLKLECLYLKK